MKASVAELLAVVISRSFREDDVGFTGLATGPRAATYATLIPLFAMQLAQLTHAPELTCLLAGWCHNPAQVDRHGNLNTVVIGPGSEKPVRLVGPILVPEHLALFGREIIMMPRHEVRSFVEQVDYVAGVGFPGGREGRARLGLRGSGPQWIVTPLCIFAFDELGTAYIRSVHPGVTDEEVRTATGFSLPADVRAPVTESPTQAELEILRTVVDPAGLLRAGDQVSA